MARRNGIRLAIKATNNSQIRKYSVAAAARKTDRSDIRSDKTPKPFSEIPGPKGLPLIGNLLSLPDMIRKKNSHEKILESLKTYGPIWKEKMGNLEIVNLAGVEAVEKLHRLDGKYPRRIILEPWRHWREENKLSKGILIEDGKEWKRMRVLLDKQMLRPKNVAEYDESFNKVTEDFIEYIRMLRQKANQDNTVPNLDRVLFNWSLETIGIVLYETRFGNFSEKKDKDIADFIEAVHQLFTTTAVVAFLPIKLNRIVFFKAQKAHEDAWECIFRVGSKVIDRRLNNINERLKKGQEVSGFLSTLLATQKMSLDEVYANISELMLAAVDTTSNTMQWVFHEVARNPDIQKKLHAEISSVIPPGQRCTHKHLQQLPYLKAVIKEALRLYPVAGVITRMTNQDMVLAGYEVPENTLVIGSTFALGRNPELYPDPLAFKPERWLRAEGQQGTHSFAWLPFGFGPRMCIGRRIAELEMHILLARVIQNFTLKPVEGHVLNMITFGLLMPDKSVNVQLVDREI